MISCEPIVAATVFSTLAHAPDEVESIIAKKKKKAHSSGSALEVITGTYPMKIRIRELCSREYLRIMFTDQGNELRQHSDSCSRKGLMFCPLNYLSVMAKQLHRRLDGCSLSSQPNASVSVVLKPSKVMKVLVTSSDSMNSAINHRLKNRRF